MARSSTETPELSKGLFDGEEKGLVVIFEKGFEILFVKVGASITLLCTAGTTATTDGIDDDMAVIGLLDVVVDNDDVIGCFDDKNGFVKGD